MLLSKTAFISEIFFSIQGEGIFIGVPQIFLRFNGCDIKCRWCDEWEKDPEGLLSVADIAERVNNLRGEADMVSLTGGEPLLFQEALCELLPALKQEGLTVYLETNGINYEAFTEVSDHIDIVAMDIKLPSACGREFWDEHLEFLRRAYSKRLFVKIVVCDDTPGEEFEKAVLLINEVSDSIPLVIQPEWSSMDAYDMSAYEAFLKIGRKVLKDVRIIPQMHKFWGIK